MKMNYLKLVTNLQELNRAVGKDGHMHKMVQTVVAASCATGGYIMNVCGVKNCVRKEITYTQKLDCIDPVHIAHGWHEGSFNRAYDTN